MGNTLTIAWKETRTYFTSPMGYIIGGVFLALTGYLFAQSVSAPFAEASIRSWIGSATMLFTLWSPVLTMRLLAEEQKLGTLELLMTSPVRDFEIVVGKYLSALAMLLSILVLTLFYALLLFLFGDPDIGPLFVGYLGLVLFGAATLAVGVLASSLTSNQIVAAVISFGILLFLTLLQQAADVTPGAPALILEQLSLTGHFDDFARGVIDTNNVVYYISFIFVSLFLAIRNLESKRWR
jgi:ABC-2 type transport system permease protein